MKKIIIVLMLFAFVAPLRAEKKAESNAIIDMVDLSSVVSNLRASLLINSKGNFFYGGQIPFISFVGQPSEVEYININAGVIYSADDKESDIMISLGIRLDSYIGRLSKSYKTVKTAHLPAIEIGPFLSYGFNKWMYGGMLSIRLGGK